LSLLLQQESLSAPDLAAVARRDGLVQLGTLGRGNHFLELQSDDDGQLWLMVHSGSRAIGQAIRARHVRRAQRTNAGLNYLVADSELGREYVRDVGWARKYAAANRRAMVDAATEILRALCGIRPRDETFFDCDHNHVQLETHFSREFWVHRKGAMSAAEGERGIIPGSMGTQ